MFALKCNLLLSCLLKALHVWAVSNPGFHSRHWHVLSATKSQMAHSKRTRWQGTVRQWWNCLKPTEQLLPFHMAKEADLPQGWERSPSANVTQVWLWPGLSLLLVPALPPGFFSGFSDFPPSWIANIWNLSSIMVKPARTDVDSSIAKCVLEMYWVFVLILCWSFSFHFLYIKYIVYYNCLISCELIGSFLLFIKVQTDTILMCASFEGPLSAVKLITF